MLLWGQFVPAALPPFPQKSAVICGKEFSCSLRYCVPLRRRSILCQNDEDGELRKIKLRSPTFKTSLGFLKNHIKPQICSIPLADLTSLALQRFYSAGFTLDTYAHVTTDAQLKAAQTMGNILSCAV